MTDIKHRILIKFPTRGRPERFKDTLEKYINFLSGKHDVKFIFTFEDDDVKMNCDEIKNYLDNLNVKNNYFYGNSKNKIEAINDNLENEDFDILILAADDMIPVYNNYDDLISKEFQKSIHGLDCVLFFQSTRWSDLLDVGCIMGKPYYDRFGYIYHPSYKSIFCDNEYTEVAKILGKSVFLEGMEPFSHQFITGDETEIKNWQFNNEDTENYNKRKINNFDL